MPWKLDPNILPFRSPPAGWIPPADAHFLRPRVMAIGDSLFNGMRSLSIDAERAAQSVPAFVARGLGAAFRPQDYPEAVLVDIERAVALPLDEILPLARLVASIPKLLDSIRENGRRWTSRCLSAAGPSIRFFDNQAVAGARAWDVFNASVATRRRHIEAFLPAVNSQSSPHRWSAKVDDTELDAIDLHMAINAKFTLDPDRDDGLRVMRPIDMVELRKPSVLLVSLGCNHGIIEMTRRGAWESAMDDLNAFADREWPACVQALAALDPAIAKIVVTLLPLPRFVPNFMPLYRVDGVKPPLDAHGYFPEYEPRIGALEDYRRVPGTEVRALDAKVADVNRRIREVVAGRFAGMPGRLVVVDPNDFVKSMDGKHHAGLGLRVPGHLSVHGRDMLYTNDAIDRAPAGHEGAGQALVGGLGSLDNGHLSLPGYIAYANAIATAIDDAAQPLPVTDRGDMVLSDLPDPWVAAMHALYIIRRAGHGFDSPPPIAEVAKALQRLTSAEHRALDSFAKLIGRALRLG